MMVDLNRFSRSQSRKGRHEEAELAERKAPRVREKGRDGGMTFTHELYEERREDGEK